MASAAQQQGAVRIEGLAELRRAFAVASKEISKDLNEVLRTSAEPVSGDAERLTISAIRNMSSTGSREIGIPWSRMRVGITRHTSYVAPVQRGSRAGSRKRRRLFDLLMGRALEPALLENRSRIEQEFEDAITDMARAWSRV